MASSDDRPASLSERTVAEEVAGGTGVVRVAVEFDPNRLYLLDERRWGPQLVAAVQAAEANAQHTRKALLYTSGGTQR
jgi:hypothetical protein